MTAQARITQADIERVTKGVRAAGYAHPRFVFDFANQKIEVIIDESGSEEPERNPFDEV